MIARVREPGEERRPRLLMTRSRPAAGWFSLAWSVLLVLQAVVVVPGGPDRLWLGLLAPSLMAPACMATWLHLRRRTDDGPGG
jgi:hypothetical protein